MPPHPPLPAPPVAGEHGRSILSNSLFVMLARVMQLAVGFLLLAGVARYLPVARYGEFGYITTLAASTMAMTYFGLQQTIIKEMARDRTHAARHLGAGLVLRSILCLVAILGLVLADVLTDAPREIMLATLLCATGEACRSLAMLSGAAFQAYERMIWEPVLTLAQSLTALVLVGLAIWLDWGFLALFGGVTASLMLQVVLSWAVCARRFIAPAMPSAALVKSMLSVAVVVGLGVFFNRNLVRVSTLIVKWMEGPEAVAWFQLPHDFILRFGLVPQAIMLASFPVFARLMLHDRAGAERLYQLFFRYTLAWGPGVSLALAFFAEDLILLCFGARYVPGVPVFQWMAWAITPLALDLLHMNILVAMDKQKTATLYTGVTLVLCAGGAWLAVATLGWESAAWVALASYVLLAGLSTWCTARALVAPRPGRLALLLPLALACAWGVLHVVAPVSKVLAFLAGAATYCGLLVGSGALPWQEIKQLRTLRRARPPIRGAASND
ncbi:flippase [Megalodesulfovibrio gigas]|uniref:Putative polysaccharide biosynthesis protein n=2 Tax=Megalodesulfovibrio gigas TaxID=879 RepID=T2G7B2_MEGG1|nr:flippase [Megalodesulfovibrio gigas]AGW12026.1 putative polysaccharide biosynthesis protein [Megalodesulfovibrio gigas DSM 1382 = ATCC 19364]